MSKSAFPLIAEGYIVEKGMTLRDYFAAKAMQTLVSTMTDGDCYILMAEEAYGIADSMLEQREG